MNMHVTVPVLPANGLEKHQIILHSYLKTEHLDYWSAYFHVQVAYQHCDLLGCSNIHLSKQQLMYSMAHHTRL
jgi:hypothetical protein